MAQRSPPLELIAERDWRLADERARLLAPLAEAPSCSVADIDRVARQLKLSRASVYRLLRRFRQQLLATSLLPSPPGRKTGRVLLSEAQERILRQTIEAFYLTPQRPSIAALYRAVCLNCQLAKTAAPSYKTVRARVRGIDLKRRTRLRDGPKAAADKFRPVRGALKANEPLALVQIDHTLVDVILVDDLERKPIGRPWLTLVVDVASRAVLGFFLSLNAPSSLSVALALSQAVLPKGAYLAKQKVEAAWPMQGLPRTLQVDNAKEFHAQSLIRGCRQHGIELVYRPPARPHLGGHIERLMGTLMGEVHLLPGTTFGSVAQRGAYDSQGEATMTLEELETWLAWQIAGVYHLQPHATLKVSPLEAWRAGAASMKQPIRQPKDAQGFYIDFLPYERRRIGREGIRLFNVHYWHGALGPLVNRGGRYVVKYDPRDLSRVFVIDPQGSALEVPYRDLGKVPVSLRELQRAAAQVRQAGGGAREVTEDALFHTVLRQRALIEQAGKRTRQARRQAEEVRINRPKPPAQVDKPEGREPEGPIEPFPFELWR
jgi:putative transposase